MVEQAYSHFIEVNYDKQCWTFSAPAHVVGPAPLVVSFFSRALITSIQIVSHYNDRIV